MTESVTFIVCKELLDMQEKSFKALVTMLVDGLKADVKDIKFELNEVKNSLNFSGRDIAVIQDRIKVLSNQLKEVNVQVFNHHESLGHVLGKQEYLENQSRQNKVFVTGIQESGKERWDETEDVLKSKIKELLKINDDLTIERAHRVNPKPNRRHGSYGARGGRKEDRSRPIIAKFLNWKEKERVLAAARSIKPDGVKFVQDSSQATLDRRYDLNKDSADYEAVWVEVENVTEKNFLFCYLYRHPNSNPVNLSTYLQEVLSNPAVSNKQIFLLGDFNLDLLNYDSRTATDEFVNLLLSKQFLLYVIHPTRVSDNSSTIIYFCQCT
ncbi:uncharacterized protein LOC135694613 [Rhopilema esculentum]|uniref:uncharacterized protein LOC135694613 n=1 Tax=Rhopilema esculentum TaxID=499914 RepID=UPI0031CE6504